MYMDDTRRRGPYILATLLLFALALSLWHLAPRFPQTLHLPHPPGQPQGEAYDVTRVGAERHAFYAYQREGEAPFDPEAPESADVYIREMPESGRYLLTFRDGASFYLRTTPRRITLATSDQGTFRSGSFQRGALTDDTGRDVADVYPNHAACIRAVVDADAAAWTRHGVRALVTVLLLIAGMVLLANHDRITRARYIPERPLIIMALAVLVIVLGLVVSSRRFF